MNKLKELKRLVLNGKKIANTKHMRNVPHTAQTVYDVDNTLYESWQNEVDLFLRNNNLSKFIEIAGICNKFQVEQKGNIINFEPQYNKLQNLLSVCMVLHKKNLEIDTDEYSIIKNILILCSYNNLQMLTTYKDLIGMENFILVMDELLKQNCFTFYYVASSDGYLTFSTGDDCDLLTIRGKKYLNEKFSLWNKMKRIEWKWYVEILVQILLGLGILTTGYRWILSLIRKI